MSGVKVDWSVSDASLGEMTQSPGLIQGGDSPAHQVVKVAGKTGDLDITATIDRDGGLLGSSSHSDTAQLRLVEDAVLLPESLDLFVLETGFASTGHGSGYFTVKQEPSSVMRSEFVSSNSSVRVSPLSTGSSSVSLLDLCLSVKQEARMTVKIAGVDKVLLETRDKVQLGERMSARLVMVDSNMRSLPVSSLHHVSLSVVSDKTHVSVEAGDEKDVFTVTGDSLGQAVLTASVQYGDMTISSAPASVTVYPPLTLDPRNISLIIGASFQFTVSGGPGDSSVEWSVGHSHLARTSEEGVVTSLALGSTSLTATSVGADGSVYSRDTVQVMIRPLSSLQLITPTNHILTNSMVPVYLFGQDQDMNVFSYGSASPIVNIDWSVSPGLGGVSSPVESLGHALISDNNGAVVFSASSPGKYQVSATVSISSKLEESGQYQLERDRTLTVSTSIIVSDRLSIINLDQTLTSGALLLSPGSTFQLQTNKDSVFSVEDSGVVSVSKTGLVKAEVKTGATTLTAKHGHEEVSVVVEVKPVHYLLLRAGAAGEAWSGDQLETVPRGGQLQLLVTRHDKWGREFSGHSADLELRPSRYNLIKTGAGITLDTVLRGWTVLRVRDKSSGADAWLVVKVGEVSLIMSKLYSFLNEIISCSGYHGTGQHQCWRRCEVHQCCQHRGQVGE